MSNAEKRFFMVAVVMCLIVMAMSQVVFARSVRIWTETWTEAMEKWDLDTVMEEPRQRLPFEQRLPVEERLQKLRDLYYVE